MAVSWNTVYITLISQTTERASWWQVLMFAQTMSHDYSHTKQILVCWYI